MGKLDKKVLKFLTARQEIDLDAGDIAIDLRCDEEAVEEALDSLKDQGLVESVDRKGRMFWQVTSALPQEDPDEFAAPVSGKKAEPLHDLGSETVSFDLSDIKAQAKPSRLLDSEKTVAFEPMHSHAPDMEKTVAFEPMHSRAPDMEKTIAFEPRAHASELRDETDDENISKDPEQLTPSDGGLPIKAISIAVVISVIISAIIAVMVAGGSKKSMMENILSLQRSNTQASQRIDDLVAQVRELSEKPTAGRMQPAAVNKASAEAPAVVEKHVVKAAPKQTARPVAKHALKPVAKAVHPPKKKKEKDMDKDKEKDKDKDKGKSDAPSYFNPPDESSSSAPSNAGSSSSSAPSSPAESPSTPPSSDQSAPPASGSGDNSWPSPEGGAGGN